MKFPYQESDIPRESASKHALTVTHETESLPTTSAKVVEVAMDKKPLMQYCNDHRSWGG